MDLQQIIGILKKIFKLPPIPTILISVPDRNIFISGTVYQPIICSIEAKFRDILSLHLVCFTCGLLLFTGSHAFFSAPSCKKPEG